MNIDLRGRVLAAARWQRVCTDFHRVAKRTCARCIESDTELPADLEEGIVRPRNERGLPVPVVVARVALPGAGRPQSELTENS